MKTVLFLALAAVSIIYLIALSRAVRRAQRAPNGATSPLAPSFLHLLIGFVTNFFDTLGIGSFAPTTAIFKLKNLVADEKIPGTLNVGHTLATITEAFIFIAIIEVDLWTLVLMIAASVLGSWLGAGIVSSWPRRNIQIAVGVALLIAAMLFLMQVFTIAPHGGNTVALRGTLLAVAIAGNLLLGALMEVGVGMYGPCLIMVSLLGMNPQAAFPIMMGSCAFLMPIGSLKFISHHRYDLRSALGLALGGVPAVLIAAFIVKSLPLTYLRWLVIVVVLYAAIMMLRSAASERASQARAV